MEVRREITPEVRRRVGLPTIHDQPYRWSFAFFWVVVAITPCLIGGYYRIALAVIAIGLAIIPALRWIEIRQLRARERIYEDGLEVVARVIEVEPSGSLRHDHIVRIEFLAGKTRVETAVLHCPLARRGLGPGDDVVVIYAADEPHHCLVVDRVARSVRKPN